MRERRNVLVGEFEFSCFDFFKRRVITEPLSRFFDGCEDFDLEPCAYCRYGLCELGPVNVGFVILPDDEAGEFRNAGGDFGNVVCFRDFRVEDFSEARL